MEPKKIKSLGKDVNSYIFSLKVVLKRSRRINLDFGTWSLNFSCGKNAEPSVGSGVA